MVQLTCRRHAMTTFLNIISACFGLVGLFVIPPMLMIKYQADVAPVYSVLLCTMFSGLLVLTPLMLPHPDGLPPISRFWLRMQLVLVPMGAVLMISFPLWSDILFK